MEVCVCGGGVLSIVLFPLITYPFLTFVLDVLDNASSALMITIIIIVIIIIIINFLTAVVMR